MHPITAYILLWSLLAAIASTVTGGMIMYLTRTKNPWYLLAMLAGGATIGLFLGGIYIAWTWGLDELQIWALMIPIICGSFTALSLTIFMPRALPASATYSHRRFHPAAGVVAALVVVGLGLVTVLPAFPADMGPAYQPAAKVDYLSTSYSAAANYGVSLRGEGRALTYSEAQIQALMDSPVLPVDVDTVHSSVDFPRTLADNPEEGDTMGWRITFTVAGSSPSAWTNPGVCLMYWGDSNGNGQYDSGEPILLDQDGFNRFTATPTASSGYWRAAAVWQDGSSPLFMMYNYASGSTVYLVPVHHAKNLGLWKNDGGKNFGNLKDGFTAPYDQWSWNYDTSQGTISAMEDITAFQSVSPGNSVTLEGKLYCPVGMAQETSDWYLRVLMFDWAWSSSEPVNSYDMHFSVGGGGGPGPEPPVVDASGTYWISALGLLVATVGMVAAAVKYGPKLVKAA